VVEFFAVALSPLIGYFGLRLRAMSPVELPDPSMHTIYIVDPSQMFTRYAAAFATTARMREGAQAGFLVLARLAYLAFGALPGFFVTRYLLALIVVVPAYVLLRRLYGIPAGVLAIVVILSCPVIITAWGTDYPDCAVVSYVAGALACLAMPGRLRFRPLWLTAAGVLLTLAVWSHGMGVVLAATTIVTYAALRLVRDRRRLAEDTALLASVAVVSTLGLMVASRLVLGQFNFIAPTIAAAAYLNRPTQVLEWHSSTWRWAPYDAYLLVPPSVIVAFALSFARRLRSVPTPQLFVGLACAAQVAVFAFLQFSYHVQTLEMHYFSSTLWGAVCLTLALAIAEIARPGSNRPFARWLPALMALAVPLAYEADRQVPAFGWWPIGAALAAIPVLGAAIMWALNRLRSARPRRRAGFAVAVALTTVTVTGSLLVLTVAPSPHLPSYPGLAKAPDPETTYASALGGSATSFINWYAISAELPTFVGNPTYKGEQLLMWALPGEMADLIEPIGMFHAGFNLLSDFPVLTGANAATLARRRPAELLLLGATEAGFRTALTNLSTYEPVVVKKTVLRHGTAVLNAWLIVLQLYAPAGT
jgi:4-amino-4-deoxy-L-arabinose transferase-like glycosyltransferase